MQLLLGQLFVRRVGHVDRPGPEQQRLTPVAELRNVGGELGNHGWQAGHGAHSNEAGISSVKSTSARPAAAFQNCLAHRRGVAHQADQHLRLGLVGDDVGSVATMNLADVQRAGTDVFCLQAVRAPAGGQHLNQFVDGAAHQARDRRSGPSCRCLEDDARSAPFEARPRRLSVGSPLIRKRLPLGVQVGNLGAG